MKSRVRYISMMMWMLAGIVYQACDSTLSIDEPQNFYKYIGADGDQEGVDLTTDDDGNIYILGSTELGTAGTQVYIVKTSSEGILLWEKTYGDPGENPKDIELLNNGTIAVVADKLLAASRIM